MLDPNQMKILSIKELNKVLTNLEEGTTIEYLGEFSRVDIVFIAGLFLWYQKRRASSNWEKTIISFKFEPQKDSSKNRAFEYYQYFKQIEILYGIKYYEIYNLPYLKGEDTLKDIDVFSTSFAPIIYINNETIKSFFISQIELEFLNLTEQEQKVIDLRDIYLDAIEKKAEGGNQNEKVFFSSKDTILKELKKASPIQIFVYTILYEKIKPLKGNENKGKAKIKSEKEAWQLWQFTEEYCNGLFELAKNIVEHSSEKSGVITIRVYDDGEIKDNGGKLFETHVFDFGEKGIISTLLSKTEERKEKDKIHKNIYNSDIDILKGDYQLEDFIKPHAGTRLNQQIARSIAHYGLMKFYHLIEDNGGTVTSSSIGKNEKVRDFYNFPKNIKLESIHCGTNYFFQLKFSSKEPAESFKVVTEQTGSQENIGSLSELLRFEIVRDINNFSSKAVLLQYNVNEIITEIKNRDDEELLCNIFSKLDVDRLHIRHVVINMDKVSLSTSSLLRFLAHLSETYKQSFIVYNLSYKDYEDMLKDNEDLIRTFDGINGNIPYWYNGKGILIFSKVKYEEKLFNFANMLYGQDEKDFLSINRIVSHTFPNALFRDLSEQSGDYPIPTYIRQFFYKSTLLPFDLLLCNEGEKTLFQSNLEMLVSQELKTNFENKETEINTPEKYLESLNGYKISHTHFKIGAKLHSEDFYYAKRLFSNSYYTARIALQLAMRIREEIERREFGKNISLTLAGYERYSELLLNLTQKFLIEFDYKMVNRLVTIDEGGKLTHLPDNIVIKENVIIIAPIASTGSTALKIREYVLSVKKVEFPLPHYNILWARDNSAEFKDIRCTAESQENIIKLETQWHKPIDCPQCYELDQTKPLFETDKSSLIPSLLFTTPKAKKIEGDISKAFNIEMFNESLRYKEVKRNNEHFLFSIDTEKFIEKNDINISIWLTKVKKKVEKSVKTTDKVVIISPCHESNAEFIDLVNDALFYSSATVIHYQFDADYPENFKLLYNRYFKNAKVFFVDDTIISGSTFFQLYNLIIQLIPTKELTAAIFLHNKTTPETHLRLLNAATSIYSFVNINLPPLPKISGKDPLEHETERYKNISKLVLHDVLKEEFYSKAIDVAGTEEERNRQAKNRINQLTTIQLSRFLESNNNDKKNEVKKNIIQRINQENQERKKRKKNQHLSMFNATHMIYEYFDNYSGTFDDLLKASKQDEIEGKIAMMKVLSQYPFILHKEVREKVFKWHSEWLNKKSESNPIITTYNDLEEIKFLIRRSVFLGNYQIISKPFFEIIKRIFDRIENPESITKIETIIKNQFDTVLQLFAENTYEKKSLPLSVLDKENIKNFHLFLLKQYVELIQQNSWCANKINESLGEESDFKTPQGKQFFRMLKIEVAAVLNDFYSLIIEEHKETWKNLYKYEGSGTTKAKNINSDTSKIEHFLEDNSSNIANKNKFEVSDKILALKQGNGYKSQFVKYLWIKQFLDTDKENFVSDIKYSDKIESIFSKLKFLFENNEVGAFFVVTDNQNKEYLLYDKNSSGEPYINNLNDNNHKVIYDFLRGEPDGQGIGYKTIIEYEDTKNVDVFQKRLWKDIYALIKGNEERVLEFLPDYEWLFLMRISDPEKEYKTLGLIGFYSKTNYHSDWLAKQLLMLLRENIGSFIKRHHKNDEFAALSIAEAIRRFAYLAGHGRQTMLRLANQDDRYLQKLYAPIVDTMHNLQYLFATITEKSDRKRELKKSFWPQMITKETIKKIGELKDDIFKTKLIENNVAINEKSIKKLDDNFRFTFNQQLLKFICFELIINAKKNRFHFLNGDKDCQKNSLEICFEIIDGGKLRIAFRGTGVDIPRNTRIKVNAGHAVKGETELEGLLFIHNIIKAINEDNILLIEEQSPYIEKCAECSELCRMRYNTIIVTLNPMQQ